MTSQKPVPKKEAKPAPAAKEEPAPQAAGPASQLLNLVLKMHYLNF